MIFSIFGDQQGGALKLHFVRSIRGLQFFLTIPIMNPLAGFMIPMAEVANTQISITRKLEIK